MMMMKGRPSINFNLECSVMLLVTRTLHSPVLVFVCEMKNRRPVSVLKGTVSGVVDDGSGDYVQRGEC